MLSTTGFLLIAATLAAGLAFDLSFSSIYCPPDELVKPCICNQNPSTKAIEVTCRQIYRPDDLEDVFNRIPEWSFGVLKIVDSSLLYIPASTAENSEYSTLNINGSSFVSLFDYPPRAYKLKSVYLRNVRISRGISWNLFNNTNLENLAVEGTPIRVFHNAIGKELPKTLKSISFINTMTVKIADNAFTALKNVESLTLSRLGIKILKRSMFARPGNYEYLDFGNNKITTLPDDLFEDMPKLRLVNLKNNEIATTWLAVFAKQSAAYWLDGNPLVCNCYMKWLTLDENKKRFTFSGECTGPSNVKGRQLSQLTEDHFRYCK